jgi:hypothetical protein
MHKLFLWASVLILVVLIVPTYLEACPACKTLDEPISKGFNWSILFLMAMPFTVFGLIGGTIFLHWNGYRLSVVGGRLKKGFLRIRDLLTDN